MARGVIKGSTRVWGPGSEMVDWEEFAKCKGLFGLADMQVPLERLMVSPRRATLAQLVPA